MRPRPRRLPVLLVALAMALTACSDGEEGAAESPEASEPEAADAAEAGLIVQPEASIDVHVGEDQRLIVGVRAADDGGVVAFGDVEMTVGSAENPDDVETVTGTFLPVPGAAPEGGRSQPTVLVGESGAGVYETRVDFDEPGPWMVHVSAELEDGTTREGQGAINVREEPGVWAVGEQAPRSENLTVDDIDGEEVLPVMVDSRAQEADAEIPDEHLHQTTIAESIEDGRPVVAVFSTPVYCQTQFCGPITDVVGDIARQYDDRADFVHVEVWKDFQEAELNEAAAEWIQPRDGSSGREPWTFLIDENGEIAARWDNVLDADDLIDRLEQLPTITHTEDA